MMKLLTVTINFLRVLLIPTELILVTLRQFPICLMTKNKSQFKLESVEENPNLFIINPHNPQEVIIKGSTMTFHNGNTYILNDPDHSNFILNRHQDNI